MPPSNVVTLDAGRRAAVIAEQQRLVEAQIPLIRPMALSLLATLPPSVDLDDLIGAAHLALVQAAQRYRPARGVPFGVYARPRIMGAMLDAVKGPRWREATHAPLEHAPEPLVFPAPEADIDERRRAERVKAAVIELPKRQRDAVEQRAEGKPFKVIDISTGSAKYHHRRAVRTLRKKLAGER